MKYCPKCGSKYTDESLIFCLTDGTELEPEDPAKTEAFGIAADSVENEAADTDGGRVRIDIAQTRERLRPAAPESRDNERKGISFGAVVFLVGFLLIIIAGLSAFVVYMVLDRQDQGTETSADRGSSGEDVEELKKRIEELGDRLGNRENGEGASPVVSITPTPAPTEEEQDFDEEVIQRVNSPGDGFLALRDRPSAKVGSRIAKIPHGDIVVMESCLQRSETIGGRTGKWCRIRWEGKTGWVFNVWLTD